MPRGKTITIRVPPKFHAQLKQNHPEGVSTYIARLLQEDEALHKVDPPEPPIIGYAQARCPSCSLTHRVTLYLGQIEEA